MSHLGCQANSGFGTRRCLLIATLLAIVASGDLGCGRKSHAGGASDELVILHAGSLAIPFREVSARFKELHPSVTIKAEAAGSRDTARKISDLGRRCDVLGSADYKVIENLLIPEHAAFSVRFATNEMVIAFTEHSAHADSISVQNWPEQLLAEEVNFGRSDPNRDPCGYRTVMVFQLAETYYKIPDLARRLEEKDGAKYIRPKETDLLGLLEAGEIDYVFIYHSVAAQHHLRFVTLPDEVNLKCKALSDLYATAHVRVTGKKPGEFITRRGAPMVYGVTIPENCENRVLAEAWVEFLLSDEGRGIMERNGQPPIAPALTQQLDKLPASLKPLCESVNTAE